jgi:hypothetical protein
MLNQSLNRIIPALSSQAIFSSSSNCFFWSNSVMSSTYHSNHPFSYPMIPNNYHINSLPTDFNFIGPSVRSFPADLRPTGYPIHPIGYPIQPNPTYLQPTEYSIQAPGYPIHPNPTYFQQTEPAVQSLPTYLPSALLYQTSSVQMISGVQSYPTYSHQAGPGVRIVPINSGSISMRPDFQSLPIYFRQSIPNDQSDPTSSWPMELSYRSFQSTSNLPKNISTAVNAPVSRRDVGTQTEDYRTESWGNSSSPLPTVNNALYILRRTIDSSEEDTKEMLLLMQQRNKIDSPSPNPTTQPRVLPCIQARPEDIKPDEYLLV